MSLQFCDLMPNIDIDATTISGSYARPQNTAAIYPVAKPECPAFMRGMYNL